MAKMVSLGIEVHYDSMDPCPICGMEGAPHRCDDNLIEQIDRERGEHPDQQQDDQDDDADVGLRLHAGFQMMEAAG